MIEPVDPLEGGQFEVLEPTPWASAAQEFGLVEPVHRLRRCVVIGVKREALSLSCHSDLAGMVDVSPFTAGCVSLAASNRRAA